MADDDRNFKFAVLGIVAVVAIVACVVLMKGRDTYAAAGLQSAGQENVLGQARIAGVASCDTVKALCEDLGYEWDMTGNYDGLPTIYCFDRTIDSIGDITDEMLWVGYCQ